jgi:7,8-dihydropterin-6-yl-methyl-4-(beta-D-ribofuranosyl)aminobenzene 5'-phosphate synthase
MKLTILSENQMSPSKSGYKTCSAEWGLSLFIEHDNANILFDTGHSTIYKDNAHELGVDLNSADFAVLSHHRWDHAKGLPNHEFTDKIKLVSHPEVLNKIPTEDADLFRRDFKIVSSDKPLEFSPDVVFLGQIPRTNEFEEGVFQDDDMEDDSAIAIKTPEGLVIITGCSHAGIVNICEHAKQVTGQNIHAVIGGLHLFDDDKLAVNGALDFFKEEEPEHLYPLHCIDPPTFSRFYSELGSTKYGVGDSFVI